MGGRASQREGASTRPPLHSAGKTGRDRAAKTWAARSRKGMQGAAYAAKAHISGQELAKTVIVKIDDRLAMAVLPASQKVDLQQMEQAIGTKRIEIAEEEEFRSRFPECDLGAMPPFGNLYGMDVYVSDNLVEDVEIAFNAGSFTELIKLAYSDFERLVGSRVLHFAARV
jgi:Ala-tRNA(Pro) deacylase